LGRIGSPEALEELRQFLKDGKGAVREEIEQAVASASARG